MGVRTIGYHGTWDRAGCSPAPDVEAADPVLLEGPWPGRLVLRAGIGSAEPTSRLRRPPGFDGVDRGQGALRGSASRSSRGGRGRWHTPLMHYKRVIPLPRRRWPGRVFKGTEFVNWRDAADRRGLAAYYDAAGADAGRIPST